MLSLPAYLGGNGRVICWLWEPFTVKKLHLHQLFICRAQSYGLFLGVWKVKSNCRSFSLKSAILEIPWCAARITHRAPGSFPAPGSFCLLCWRFIGFIKPVVSVIQGEEKKPPRRSLTLDRCCLSFTLNASSPFFRGRLLVSLLEDAVWALGALMSSNVDPSWAVGWHRACWWTVVPRLPPSPLLWPSRLVFAAGL